MPFRMIEYCLGVFRLFGRVQHRLIDIRTLEGERLLESEEIGDNAIAILAYLRDHPVQNG
jgi:hypothetical protein